MRESEIAFVERITAGVTHELLNVLAIIKEASGLLEDILSLKPGEPSSWDDKARAALARIGQQVGRGTDLSERLNRFAHGLAESTMRVEIVEILDQIVGLMQHTARLKRVELRIQRVDPSPVVSANPLQLQIVLGAFIDGCLDLTSSGGTITLHAEERDDTIAIRCEAAPPRAGVEESTFLAQRLAALDDVIDELGVRIVRGRSRPPSGVELHIPCRR